MNIQFTDKGRDEFHDITRELGKRGRQVAALIGVENLGRRGGPPAGAPELRDRPRRRDPLVPDHRLREEPRRHRRRKRVHRGELHLRRSEGFSRWCCRRVRCPLVHPAVERTDGWATLGKGSLQEAKIAAAVGILAVALFLLIAYRSSSGSYAIIGFTIYGVFLYGTILIFNVTLTLPGLAGLILLSPRLGWPPTRTSLSSNESKEEVPRGQIVRAAHRDPATQKGFSTIVDRGVRDR